jgi:ABC-type polysaccharide/polyol phosphate export permease
LHNALIYIAVVVIFEVDVGLHVLWLPLGLGLILINAVWLGLFAGTVVARYRDLQPIVMAVMQVAFFVTPVVWPPELLTHRVNVLFVDWNPLAHFLELVRAPLLGQAPPPSTWLMAGGIAVLGWLATVILFARKARGIPFWV